MPAAIAEVDGKTMMAYQGEMPWHKLGTKCDSLRSVDAALKAAHLDWKVGAVQLAYKPNDKPVKVPRKVLYRKDKPDHWLSTVGMDYQVAQNEDLFATLQPACEKLGMTIETAGALGVRGDQVWMLGKLPRAAVSPVDGDRIDGYVLVLGGHNGWRALTWRLTPIRVVCANTLALAMKEGDTLMTLRHTESGISKIDEAAKLVTQMVAAFKKTGESFAQLAARKLTPNELRTYVNTVLNIDDNEKETTVKGKRRERILELAATGKGVEFAPSTAWTAFNAVTEFVDHVLPSEGKAVRTIKNANTSAVFGPNSKLKVKALLLARQLAA